MSCIHQGLSLIIGPYYYYSCPVIIDLAICMHFQGHFFKCKTDLYKKGKNYTFPPILSPQGKFLKDIVYQNSILQPQMDYSAALYFRTKMNLWVMF